MHISEESVSADHLLSIQSDIKFNDRLVVEKSTYALVLLLQLVEKLPELVFKGGTSILLRNFPPKRFSIDIDIILPTKAQEDIEVILENIVGEGKFFQRFQPDQRRSQKRYISHYFLYFNSYHTGSEQYVLLDILYLDDPPYASLEKKEFNIPLIRGEHFPEIRIPSIEGLFADKLVAIAGNDLGIPLNDQFEMQYVKQVIDLETLFDKIDNITDLQETFSKVVQLENTIHSTGYSPEETAHSVIKRALEYCRLNLPGANPDSPVISHMQSGLNRIGSTLVERYRSEALKIAIAKAAYGAALLLAPQTESSIVHDPASVDATTLSNWKSIEWMDSLRRTNETGFFYLALALEESGLK